MLTLSLVVLEGTLLTLSRKLRVLSDVDLTRDCCCNEMEDREWNGERRGRREDGVVGWRVEMDGNFEKDVEGPPDMDLNCDEGAERECINPSGI